MVKAVNQRAERIIRLFPKIISSIGKMHQNTINTDILDTDDVNLSNLRLNNKSGVTITFNQYLTLLALQELAECSVNELSRELNIAQSTASQLVDRLVKAGLVSRVTHKTDRRRMVLSLSNTGLEMMKRRTNMLRGDFIRILEALNKNEQRMLEEAFTKLYIVADKLKRK